MKQAAVNWQNIDTVLLDMDGTLLDLHFDNHFWLTHLPEAYAKQRGLSFTAAFDELQAISEACRGTLQWYCLDYWCECVQMDIPALKSEVQHLIQPRSGALAFLQALYQAGKRSVLVTNAHRDSIELKMLNTELGSELDRVMSSHDFGYPKEEQAFWCALQEAEPFDKQRTLFIDDTEAVLKAAQLYGIAALLGILQPDSHKPELTMQEHDFPLLSDFSSILPI